MTGRSLHVLTAATGLALAACAHAPVSWQDSAMNEPLSPPPSPPVLTSGELSPAGDPVKAAEMNIRPVEWPLRFNKHNFDARCYGTLECSVVYDDFDHGGVYRDRPSPSSDSRGPDYLKGWNGSFGGVINFPPPAKVVWRTQNGVQHRAEIDIGEIFKDQRVLHHVPREEMADQPDGKYRHNPSILLEINENTIRVYMSAFVPTKHMQIPGNRYSGARYDLILVKTYTF